MVAARFPGHLGDEGTSHERPGERGAQDTFSERSFARRWRSQDEISSGSLELFGIRDEFVDQSDAQRLVGAHRFPGKHHFHRGAHTGNAHGAYGAAEPRVNAEQHFRQTQ